MKSLFTLGRIVATPGTLVVIEKSGQLAWEFLTRHINNNWGEARHHCRKNRTIWNVIYHDTRPSRVLLSTVPDRQADRIYSDSRKTLMR